MKNAIFICVFHNEKYVDLCLLLLESLLLYGNLDENTDILLYTSTIFKKRIQESSILHDKIRFEINDGIQDLDSACKSRLDLFELSAINKYDKILYLDSDIIVKKQVNILFDLVKEDVLYVLEEGDLERTENYWGKDLFTTDEINSFEDKTTFNSGVLLFNNCENMRILFEKIKEDMRRRNHSFYDQPFFIYNAFKYGWYNNKVLKQYIMQNDPDSNIDVTVDRVLHHFAGYIGNGNHKYEPMVRFLKKLKDLETKTSPHP